MIVERWRNRQERAYRLACQGLDEAELLALYRAIEEVFDERPPRFRNPFPQSFDAKTVHEIIVLIGRVPVAYVGKKVVDILAGLIESKLNRKPTDSARVVTIYGPDGAVASQVTIKPRKPKTR